LNFFFMFVSNRLHLIILLLKPLLSNVSGKFEYARDIRIKIRHTNSEPEK
ncbi:uncharacterized protein METZ01_LOCUS502483, partial [marine metagenome]